MSRHRRTTILIIAMIAAVIGATGCVPAIISTVVSDWRIDKAQRQVIVLETQALRMNAGLSREEFEREMWRYVPDEYLRFLERELEIEGERRGFASQAEPARGPSRRPSTPGTKPRSVDDTVRRSPDLQHQLAKARAEAARYNGSSSPWDLRSMHYRATRLLAGASEAEIIAELDATMPSFRGRRAEK